MPERARLLILALLLVTTTGYKRYLVNRYEQCNGSVTETVVAGSTTYHWGGCWTWSGGFCSFSWGPASPTC